MAKKKSKAGRPTLYKDEYPDLAFKYCLLGATDKELADFFEVSEDTVHEWKKVYPKFSESIKAGKERADAEIAQSLYQRAKGYSHDDVNISNYQGDITITPITKHYPPDTKAATYWLNNRQRIRWRDKTDVEVSGKDGEAIKTEASLSPELEELIKQVAGKC